MTAATVRGAGGADRWAKRRFFIVWVAMAVLVGGFFPAAPVAAQDAAGESDCRFPDVSATSPAHADITHACRQGWFTGYPDGSFRPDRPIPAHQIATVVGRAFAAGATRADMATFLRGGNPGVPAAPARFPDVPATHPQNRDIAYAVEQSWFQGYPDDTFRPDRVITATQITTVLTRAFPAASTRAQLATFMRNGQQALDVSWDGKTIVYVTGMLDADGDPAGYELRAARGDGPEGKLLADDPYGFPAWGWQPGENRVAYMVLLADEDGEKSAEMQVRTADADGSGSRLLIDGGGDWGWSPDGDRLFYTLSDVDAEGMLSGSGLWAADGDGSDARLVASSSEVVYGLQWSPAGDRFTFTFSGADNGESFKLWVAEGDGSSSYTMEEAWIIFDTWGWSPEGRLAYATVVRDEDGSRWVEYELWADDGRGTEARLVIKHPEVIYGVRWSPNGDRIAYLTPVRDSGGQAVGNALRVVADDGSDPVLLTDDLFKSNSWAWSPDGERIAYETDEGLRAANGDGSGIRRLTDAPGGVWGWSPDGERLAYRSGGEVWVDEGSEKRLVADHPADIAAGGWSPNGERFAYTSASPESDADGEGTANELWAVGLDGSEPRRLADNVGDRWEWSADGNWIAYAAPPPIAVPAAGEAWRPARELWMVGAGGSEPRLLSRDVIDWAWRPADAGLYNFRRPFPAVPLASVAPGVRSGR